MLNSRQTVEPYWPRFSPPHCPGYRRVLSEDESLIRGRTEIPVLVLLSGTEIGYSRSAAELTGDRRENREDRREIREDRREIREDRRQGP